MRNTGADRFRVTAEDQERYRALHERAVSAEKRWWEAYKAYEKDPPKPDPRIERINRLHKATQRTARALRSFHEKYPDMICHDWTRIARGQAPRPLTPSEKGQNPAAVRETFRLVWGGKG